jgi:hypothetical protein
MRFLSRLRRDRIDKAFVGCAVGGAYIVNLLLSERNEMKPRMTARLNEQFGQWRAGKESHLLKYFYRTVVFRIISSIGQRIKSAFRPLTRTFRALNSTFHRHYGSFPIHYNRLSGPGFCITGCKLHLHLLLHRLPLTLRHMPIAKRRMKAF